MLALETVRDEAALFRVPVVAVGCGGVAFVGVDFVRGSTAHCCEGGGFVCGKREEGSMRCVCESSCVSGGFWGELEVVRKSERRNGGSTY